MKRLDKGNINWYLFNLYGIQITDQDNWRDFIFEDATIVNAKQLREYFEEIHYPISEFIGDFSTRYKPEQTFLVVQIGGKITNDKEKENLRQAEKRAIEIASFIFFVFLYLSNYRIGITLDSQLFSGGKSSIYLFTSYRMQYLQERHFSPSHIIIYPEKPFLFTREKIEGIFNKQQFGFLFDIVKNKKNTSILESLVNFYLTINVPSPITQLLGAVTSIEILLKTDDSKYKNINNRIKTLLGDDININKYYTEPEKIKEIFSLRHDVIHEGKDCTKIDARRAIELFSYVIIGYSHIFKEFNTKDRTKVRICKHLDMMNSIQHDRILSVGFYKDIITKWNSIKFNLSIIDWLVQWLINYFKLCNQDEEKINNNSYTSSIVLHSKIRQCCLEESFKLINQLLYCNDNPFNSFDEFKTYYTTNKQLIDNNITIHEKWNPFIYK